MTNYLLKKRHTTRHEKDVYKAGAQNQESQKGL